MTTKPVIFFSHINEEKDLAVLLQESIEAHFLGMIEVFVSSDGESIGAGEEWLEKIFAKLKAAVAMLILCSEASVSRPWINFEAGAGWIRKRLAISESLEVVPICHTGFRPESLPLPLKLLNGIVVSERTGLEQLFNMIAQKLGSDVPKVPYPTLIKKAQDFEFTYGTLREVRVAVRSLCEISPDIDKFFPPQSAIPYREIPTVGSTPVRQNAAPS